MSDAVSAPTIITPHALPMFRDGEIVRGSKRKREKDRMDPRKSKRPELPVTGPGRGGRVGASATQHVVQNLVRDTTRDEDVRALFFSLYSFPFCVIATSCAVHLNYPLHRLSQSAHPRVIASEISCRPPLVCCRSGAALTLTRCSALFAQLGGSCRCDTPPSRCVPEGARPSVFAFRSISAVFCYIVSSLLVVLVLVLTMPPFAASRGAAQTGLGRPRPGMDRR